MVRMEPTAEASLAAIRERSRLGIAMAAIIKIIATTISNSINEKPFCLLVMQFSWTRISIFFVLPLGVREIRVHMQRHIEISKREILSRATIIARMHMEWRNGVYRSGCAVIGFSAA